MNPGTEGVYEQIDMFRLYSGLRVQSVYMILSWIDKYKFSFEQMYCVNNAIHYKTIFSLTLL